MIRKPVSEWSIKERVVLVIIALVCFFGKAYYGHLIENFHRHKTSYSECNKYELLDSADDVIRQTIAQAF